MIKKTLNFELEELFDSKNLREVQDFAESLLIFINNIKLDCVNDYMVDVDAPINYENPKNSNDRVLVFTYEPKLTESQQLLKQRLLDELNSKRAEIAAINKEASQKNIECNELLRKMRDFENKISRGDL